MVKNELIYIIKDYRYSEAIELLKIIDDDIINSYEVLEDNPLFIMCNIFNDIIYNKYYLNNYFIINEKNNEVVRKTLNIILGNTKAFYTLFNMLLKRNIHLNSEKYEFLLNFCSLIDNIKFFHQNENNQIDYNNFVNIPLFIDYLIHNNIQDSVYKNKFLYYLLNNYNVLNEDQLNVMYVLINQNCPNQIINNDFINCYININNYNVLSLLKDNYTFKINDINNCFKIKTNDDIMILNHSNNCVCNRRIIKKEYYNDDYNKMLDTFINLGYIIKIDSYCLYYNSLLYQLIELNLFDIAEKIICKNNVYINYESNFKLNREVCYPLLHLIQKYIECNNIKNKPYFKNILHFYLDKKVYCDNEVIKYLIDCKHNDLDELLKLIITNYKNIDLTNDKDNFNNSLIYKTLKNHKYNLTIILLENNAFCSYHFITFKQSLIYYIIKLINGNKEINNNKTNNELDAFYKPLIDNTENDTSNAIKNNEQINEYKLLIDIIKLIYKKDTNYNIEMLKSHLSKSIVNYIIS